MYCTPAGQACVEKVSKEAGDCKTSCEGLYLDVFRADDTKLTTDVMKIGNMIHGLAKTGNFSNQPWNFSTFVIFFSVQDRHRITNAAFEEIINSAAALTTGKKKELLSMIEEYKRYKRSMVRNLKFDPTSHNQGIFPV